MGDDFKVGDVVVCVRDYPLNSLKKGTTEHWAQLKIGSFYRVTALVKDRTGERGVTLAGLRHEPFPGWSNKLFRKLPPADQSFTDVLRCIAKPKDTTAPAIPAAAPAGVGISAAGLGRPAVGDA